MKHCKYSIITINYNNAEGLKSTIESVLAQTNKNFEYIVIDGASTDNSVSVIEQYANALDYWVSEPDQGIYEAMNKGTKAATGEFCLFLNSGDVLYDQGVMEAVIQKNATADLQLGRLCYERGKEEYESRTPTLLTFYERSLLHPCTFIKRELLLKRPYDEALRIVSDWKFFMQVTLFDHCSYEYLHLLMTLFDITGVSNNDEHKNLVAIERQRVLEELFPKRVLVDYQQFTKGEGWERTPYDLFFVEAREHKHKRLLYSLSVGLLKILAFFHKGSRFVEKYPLRLPKDKE